MKHALLMSSVLVGLLLPAGNPASARALDVRDVAAEAKWLAHLDVERLVSSEIGKLLLGELEKRGDMQRIEAFGTLFDFNPMEDLQAVTAYGTVFGNEEAVVLFKGRFNREKVIALISMEGTRQELEVGGFTVHKRQKGSEVFFLCFFGEDTIVFSNKEHLLRLGLSVLTGEKPALTDGGPLREMQFMPEGTFFAAGAEGFGNLDVDHPQALVLKKAEEVRITVGELEANVFVAGSLTMTGEETARQVHDVIKGLLALGQVFGEQKPELAKLAGDVRLALEGVKVSLRLTRPAQDVFQLLQKVDK